MNYFTVGVEWVIGTSLLYTFMIFCLQFKIMLLEIQLREYNKEKAAEKRRRKFDKR